MAFSFLLALGSPAAAAEGPERFEVGGLTVERPQGWDWVERRGAMRQAQLEVKTEGVEGSAEVVFFHFGPGNGGGTMANIDRWLGQFAEPRDQLKHKVEEETVSGRKVTYVQAEGTYQSGMPGGPKTPLKDHALIGAIIEGAQGHVFVRMTGPSGLAKASIEPFKTMVVSGLK
jgi:hypothetical protein